jgi:hypothetical protein
LAGKIVQQQSATITAATTSGYITVASVSGFYKSAVCNLSKVGQPSIEVTITEVVTTSNQLGIRFKQQIVDYGMDDVSLYNGGNIYQSEQFIYNPNDKPLD